MDGFGRTGTVDVGYNRNEKIEDKHGNRMNADVF